MKKASSDLPWIAASVCRFAALLTENICNSFDLHGFCAVSFCQKVCVEELWKRAEDNTNVLQTAEGITECSSHSRIIVPKCGPLAPAAMGV